MYNILTGSVLEQLATIADESVQTAITSPPYWGLRDYGTGTWTGGDPHCTHSKRCSSVPHGSTLASAPTNSNHERAGWLGGVCGKCGAYCVDRQIGLEATPEEYVAKLVAVFREVRRTLRKDGTLWLNLGDSYAGYHGNKNAVIPTSATNGWTNGTNENMRGDRRPQDIGLKQKDLVGIPWMVAFALRSDGWYLRQDIIWHKPNPMPESVADRCTKSHEYVFLLSKSPRYAFNTITESAARPRGSGSKSNKGAIAYAAGALEHRTYVGLTDIGPRRTRNKRDVWTIPSQPFKGAHFAVFPEKLVELCLVAGSNFGDTVLDPFCGSGTVGVVAQRYERNFIGIELNPDYVTLAHSRIGRGSRHLETESE